MTMAGSLSVTPVRPSVRPSVRTYVRTNVCPYVTPNDVRSLRRIVMIRILWTLVSLFSSMMSSSSSIMVHTAPSLQESWPFVYEKSQFETKPALSNTLDQNSMKVGHIVKYYDVFFKFDNGLYRTMSSGVIALSSWKFTIFDGVRSISQVFWSKFYKTWSHCWVP